MRNTLLVASCLVLGFACSKEETDDPPIQFGKPAQQTSAGPASPPATPTPPPPPPAPTATEPPDAGEPADAGAADAAAPDGGSSGNQGCVARCQSAMSGCMLPKVGQFPDPGRCQAAFETCRKACF